MGRHTKNDTVQARSRPCEPPELAAWIARLRAKLTDLCAQDPTWTQDRKSVV